MLALAPSAVFACLTGLLVIPASLLVGRYCRGKVGWWRIHALLNAVGAVLIVVVFALGMASVGTADEGTQFSGDEADMHHKLGLAILLLVLVQVALGCVAHFVFRPEANAKHVEGQQDKASPVKPAFTTTARTVRLTHITLGIITVGLLYWCMWDGLHTEWASMSTSLTSTPKSLQILFWLFFLGPMAAYLLHAGSHLLSGMERRSIVLP